MPECAAGSTIATVAPGDTSPVCAGVSGAVRLPMVADTPEMDSRVIPVVDSVEWEDETPMTKVSGEVAFVRVVSLYPWSPSGSPRSGPRGQVSQDWRRASSTYIGNRGGIWALIGTV